MEGRVGRTSWEAREEGSTQQYTVAKNSQSVWNVHGGARYWPSIVLPRNGPIFFLFFVLFFISLVVWRQNAISVSCIMSCVYVIMVWECGCVFARLFFYPPCRRHHAWCEWWEDVCATMYLLLGQCFVFIALLTHCKEQRTENGNDFEDFGRLFMNVPSARIFSPSWPPNILLQVSIQLQFKVQLSF